MLQRRVKQCRALVPHGQGGSALRVFAQSCPQLAAARHPGRRQGKSHAVCGRGSDVVVAGASAFVFEFACDGVIAHGTHILDRLSARLDRPADAASSRQGCGQLAKTL
jgi:hypothetical protein